MSVHAVAQSGFGVGTNELYDSARPSYPKDALAHIYQAASTPSGGLNIVEIGSGTGIFTRAFLAQSFASNINAIKAIEPSQGMRDVFSKTVKDERVSVAEGTFDTTNVEAGWADLVIIAQAFHWCPDYNKAASHFAHILKPDGVVAFVWNLENRDDAEWVQQLRDLYEGYEHGTPQFRLGLWRQTFDTPEYRKHFMPPVEEEWTHNIEATESSVRARVFSKSYIAILPDTEKEQVAKGVASIVQNGKGKVWIDESKGVFEYPYKTLVVLAKRQL